MSWQMDLIWKSTNLFRLGLVEEGWYSGCLGKNSLKTGNNKI
jgi:hypothetical protein